MDFQSIAAEDELVIYGVNMGPSKAKSRQIKAKSLNKFCPEQSLTDLFKDILPNDIYRVFEQYKILELIQQQSPKAWNKLLMHNQKTLIRQGAIKKAKATKSEYEWCEDTLV